MGQLLADDEEDVDELTEVEVANDEGGAVIPVAEEVLKVAVSAVFVLLLSAEIDGWPEMKDEADSGTDAVGCTEPSEPSVTSCLPVEFV
jgi:hypothetical protein